MADYHFPQQCRRDKLRVVAQNHPHLPASTGLLLPLYDPSLISSDLVPCASSNPLSAKSNPVKEGGAKLMSFVGGIATTTYLDQQSSLPLNRTSLQDINGNGNPFLYTLQNLRDFDHPFHGGCSEPVEFKPEPLSLSLSSQHSHQSNLPLDLSLQKYGSTVNYAVPDMVGVTFPNSNDLCTSSVPLGPFTGYASILKGSRFLKPAQQLLAEICDVGRGIYFDKKITLDGTLMDPPVECLNSCGIVDDPQNSGENGRKKSKLIMLLDEVYRRYKHCYQQMQAVVASFECVAGFGNAAPYANIALKIMSKHFKSLKNAITDQLQFINKVHGQLSYGKEETLKFGKNERYPYVRPVQNSGLNEHQPVWRPQRGLPECAVTVLRAWLFDNFLHPYPTDTDKLMLAKQTGLSRSQVSNWFINARVRLWKPMVEEIHMLESQRDEPSASADKSSDHQVLVSETDPSTSTQRAQDVPPKRSRNNHPPGNGSLSSVGVGMSTKGRSSGVSLTLGLHQNNGLDFPLNAAQHFGLSLETGSEGFVMGGFEMQNRLFGRDVMGMGGQLLHDFVG